MELNRKHKWFWTVSNMKTFKELQQDEMQASLLVNSIIPIFIYIIYLLIKQKFKRMKEIDNAFKRISNDCTKNRNISRDK